MKTKIFLSFLALGVIVSAISQNTLELTFTAINSSAFVQLDSIKVMNRTQGGDTVLYYPDTLIVLDYQVGISETYVDTNEFQVFQNYPNPVKDHTTISFYVPERDKVSLIVTDVLGRTLIKSKRFLDHGYHSCRFTPGNGSLFLFTVQWRESQSSIKILQINPISSNKSTIEHMGGEESSPALKATEDIQSFLFSLGDELLYIGYIDTLQSGMLDAPEESNTYTFQLATNIPCPGTQTVDYEGQVYNTIQIFSQCWLKENLNVGMMIPGGQWQGNNDTIEKWCYNNEPDSCSKYGGLYEWSEIMNHSAMPGEQGICPPGWHPPTDEEWKLLEGAVDSYYGIGDPEWDNWYIRGYNAGMNLKSTSGWNFGINGNNIFGFTAIPGGSWDEYANFGGAGYAGTWWTATGSFIPGNNFADSRLLWDSPQVYRGDEYGIEGRSVRCIMD